jgi:hypothetical protein
MPPTSAVHMLLLFRLILGLSGDVQAAQCSKMSIVKNTSDADIYNHNDKVTLTVTSTSPP